MFFDVLSVEIDNLVNQTVFVDIDKDDHLQLDNLQKMMQFIGQCKKYFLKASLYELFANMYGSCM